MIYTVFVSTNEYENCYWTEQVCILVSQSLRTFTPTPNARPKTLMQFNYIYIYIYTYIYQNKTRDADDIFI